jgi:hypothetical protein
VEVMLWTGEEERFWKVIFAMPMLPDHVSGSYLCDFSCLCAVIA